MIHLLRKLWRDDDGQDIAEYAVMLAVTLVLVVGTVRLIGSNANNGFSTAASLIVIVLVLIFWELSKINSRLKKVLAPANDTMKGNKETQP
jgi:Flp pilus assembly pilin Flp